MSSRTNRDRRWGAGPRQRPVWEDRPVWDDSRSARYLPDAPPDRPAWVRREPAEPYGWSIDSPTEYGYGSDWPPATAAPPAYEPTEPGPSPFADDEYPFGYGPIRPQGARGTGFRSRGPKDYVRSDDRIREDLCEWLTASESIDASDVTVEVESGTVTLSGNVPDRQMKHAIEDLAAGCLGVQDVQNRLRVETRLEQERDSPTQPRPAPGAT